MTYRIGANKKDTHELKRMIVILWCNLLIVIVLLMNLFQSFRFHRRYFMNNFLNFLQRYKFHWIIEQLVYIGYKRRRKKVQRVTYEKSLKAWIFTLDGFHFVSRGPGWVQDFDYLLDNLKKYSGHYYLPKAGDIVIDLGAGVGEETLTFSKLVGSNGKVFSIEAHPSTASILKYACAINKLENVIVDNLAIADTDGEIIIQDEDNDYLKNTISSIPGSDSNATGVPVEAITLDHYIEKNKIIQVDFLKVNIEGAEQLMLQGMSKCVNQIKNLAISCHDFRWAAGESEFYKTHDEVLAFLESNNFKVIQRQTGDVVLDSYLYAVKA